MIEDPECPACGRHEWRRLGERIYAGKSDGRWGLQVLFAVWVPKATEFRVTFLGCEACGMVIYAPRPSAADLDATYRFAPKCPANGSAKPARKTERPRRTAQRIRRIQRFLSPHLPRSPNETRILDFGGGDGRLLKGYADKGAQCDVIDYASLAVAGVRHVGMNEHDLPNVPTYDAIVLSHVVEHMADPHAVLTRLRAALKEDGAIFVDVPMEISATLPARNDPVTHVNFFIPESLSALLARAGYRVETCELTDYPHPNEGWQLCVTAVATIGEERKTPRTSSGFAALKSYLEPDFGMRFRKTRLRWRDMPGRQFRRLKGLAGRFR